MPYVQYPKPRPNLPRAKATLILNRVIARAAEINGEPKRFPYAVRRLAVFGSYLTDKEILGDLDIAVEIQLVRPMDCLVEERPGWRPIHWAELTYVALRVRKPKVVSIHDMSQVLQLGTNTRLVFEDRKLKTPNWSSRSS